jgi:hypothetical protein
MSTNLILLDLIEKYETLASSNMSTNLILLDFVEKYETLVPSNMSMSLILLDLVRKYETLVFVFSNIGENAPLFQKVRYQRTQFSTNILLVNYGNIQYFLLS